MSHQPRSPSIDDLLTAPLPRSRFPETGGDADAIEQQLVEELLLDGNAKLNLATFCQTWESPHVHRLMDLAIDKNLIDKDEYPQTAEIERRCVALLADLWHAPGAAVGCSTIGSSEAAMLGGMAAKWRWRARQRAAGRPVDRPNMVCGSVQICWKKFARYWDIELRLPDDLVFHVSYLGGDMPTFQINFSRPAGQVIAQYFDFVRLGRAGYARIHGTSHAVARFFAAELAGRPGFRIVHDGDPARGIPAVVWTVAADAGWPFTLHDLSDRLRMRGWQVPTYPFTGTLAATDFQRILVKRDFTREMAELLLADIDQAVAHLTAAAPSGPGTSRRGSYSHL